MLLSFLVHDTLRPAGLWGPVGMRVYQYAQGVVLLHDACRQVGRAGIYGVKSCCTMPCSLAVTIMLVRAEQRQDAFCFIYVQVCTG